MTGPGEAVSEGQRAAFTLTLSEPSRVPRRVMVTTTPGSATYGVDYFAPVKQSILFAPGQISKTFSISTLRDSGRDRAEGRETFTVHATPEDRRLAARSTLVTIVDTVGASSGSGVTKSNFQITFSYDSSVTADIQSKLLQAADRWSKVIVGDLPDVTYQGRKIDDIEISVTVLSASSLPDGVIAGARYDQRRPGAAGLPFLGSIGISDAYADAPGITNTLTHEIGHALGFGSLWQDEPRFASLVTGIGTSNPAFVGANAVREYKNIFGQTARSVPLFEQSDESPATYDGSYGSHWRDSVFNASGGRSFELMTSSYNVNGTLNGAALPAMLSRVTVGAMQDLGYVVNYSNADAYGRPAAPMSGQKPAGGSSAGASNARGNSWSRAFASLDTDGSVGALSQSANHRPAGGVDATNGPRVAVGSASADYRQFGYGGPLGTPGTSAEQTQRPVLASLRGTGPTPLRRAVVASVITKLPILS